ncbi:hypothetical protein NN561_010820 [Cricetulus griseus]
MLHKQACCVAHSQLNLPCSEKHRRGWRRRESPAWTTKSRKNGGHKHCARTKNWTDTGKTMATASKKRGVRAALSQNSRGKAEDSSAPSSKAQTPNEGRHVSRLSRFYDLMGPREESELTAIVQNQQSLIHTQRQRIDELERRLDELSAENRSLWEHQQLLQAQPPPGLVPPSTAPLPAPTTTAPAATAAQEALQDHGQLPPATPEPPLQHHGQLLAQPQPGPSSRAQAPQSPHQHSVVPGAVADKEKERPPSCCAAAGALLQHTSPAALGKGVLSRRPE